MTTKGKLLVTIVNLAGGGAERVVSNLTRTLEDWEIHLALFEEAVDYPYDAELHTLGADLHRGSRPRKAVQLARALAGLGRVKRRVEPDVSLSFLFWPNVFNILSSPTSRERVVASVRNSRSDALLDDNGSLRANGYRMLVEHVYNRADGIISISEGVAGDLSRNFGVAPERLQTIYNPVDVAGIRTAAAEPLPEPYRPVFEDPTVVHVGRFHEQKGQRHLIRAHRRVLDRAERSRLVLLGEGPLEEELVGLADDLGMPTWHGQRDPPSALREARVVFAGFRANPHRFVGAASLFAFPSLYEGLGSVLLEALACETAVVASDCDFGPREILAPATDPDRRTRAPTFAGYGVLMPRPDGATETAGDPLTEVEAQWAETVADLLDDPERRASLTRAGRRRIEEFRTDTIVDQWEEALT